MKARSLVSIAAFGLAAGAIAYGVLTDARDARLQQLLVRIESADEKIPYIGTRLLGGPETVALKIWSEGGRKHVEFLGLRNGSLDSARDRQGRSRPPRGLRVPFFGNIPAFLRPGHDQWKRRVKDFELAVRNYEVVLAGSEVVAGRLAEVIELRARHPGRPSYRISADQENRFPLAFQVISEGSRVFDSRFESIDYHPRFPEKVFDEAPKPGWLKVTREEVPADRVTARAGFPLWAPSRLPKGFELRGAEVYRVRLNLPEGVREAAKPFLPGGLPRIDLPVAHFNYTDGMAVLAVVECPADSEFWKFLRRFLPAVAQRPNGAKAEGKVVAQKFCDRRGSAYLLELENTAILVAGNVSPAELEMMIPTFERR